VPGGTRILDPLLQRQYLVGSSSRWIGWMGRKWVWSVRLKSVMDTMSIAVGIIEKYSPGKGRIPR
jgi:hypothetical protein